MEIVFEDASLAMIESDMAGETKLPVAVIKAARRKLTVLRAAIDDQSLQNWKNLHYERLKGDRDGQRSIKLNDQYRMVFVLTELNPLTAAILAIEDSYL